MFSFSRCQCTILLFLNGLPLTYCLPQLLRFLHQSFAVSAFEKYKIKDVRTASAFEDEYDKVNAIIAKIPDEYAQGPYKERVATKYNSLKDIVKNKWEKAIKEAKADEADKIQSKKMWWELKGCVRIEKIAMEISE